MFNCSRSAASAGLVCLLLGLVACGSGSSTPVMNSPATLNIRPASAGAVVNTQNQQFTPIFTGNPKTTALNWTVDGVAGGDATSGTVSPTGLYTPPATAGLHSVVATTTDGALSASATIAITDLTGVYTNHNDLARDGANQQEYALNATTVNQSAFGKLFSCPVDGAIYAQPLWVASLNINGGTHNVVLVATQHDSLYAFDADASPCVTYWHVNLLDPLHGGIGDVPVLWTDVGYCYGAIYPEIGVTGTPVIDPSTNTLYVVSASEVPGPTSGTCPLPPGGYYHRLHALDLASGNEQFNAPVTISASVLGDGDGSSGGVVSFNSQTANQRAGLILSNGIVYVPFAAHEDARPFHGWLIGYSANDIQVESAVFNTTPNGLNGADGGIWGGGGAPAVDATGDIYITTGNGVYDGPAPNADYGDTTLRLHPFAGSTPNGINLMVSSWFTPYDQLTFQQNDRDLGSGVGVVMPDQTSGPILHLLVQTGKDGSIYLMDRDNMGQYNPANNNQIVQNFKGTKYGTWGVPAFWQNNLYTGGEGEWIRQYAFDPVSGKFNPATASQSAAIFRYPGASPSVTSMGADNGIVWAVDVSQFGYSNGNAGVSCKQLPLPAACTGPAVLHAYDAENLTTEYWNSSLAPNGRDQAGNAVKFVVPTVANGKVYLGTSSELDVYGLLPN